MFGPLKYEYAHGNPKDPFHFVREGEKEREKAFPRPFHQLNKVI